MSLEGGQSPATDSKICGAIYASVAEDMASNKYGWKRSETCRFFSEATSIEQVENAIPGVKQAIMDCLEAMAVALRRRGLIMGDFSQRFVVDPILYDDKKTLLNDLRDMSRLGEFKSRINEVSDSKQFEKDVFAYAEEYCETDATGISAAYFAIMVSIMDASVGTE